MGRQKFLGIFSGSSGSSNDRVWFRYRKRRYRKFRLRCCGISGYGS